MTFHVTFLSVRQLGYKSRATSVNQPGCSYFTFHQQDENLDKALSSSGNLVRLAGELVSSYHM